jgi:ribonucleotide monophosphatase NagD (HAD superfamily)
MRRVVACARRRAVLASSTTARASSSGVGAVFDIDGVVLRGHKALPGARDALLRLNKADIPFIFLTNGAAPARVECYHRSCKLLHGRCSHVAARQRGVA